MIARVWKGNTKTAHSEIYTKIIEERDIPYYSKTEGFIKLSFLKRTDNQITYFKLITYWEDINAVKLFAGPSYKEAVGFEEDEKYLIDFPGSVMHFEVFA